MTHCYIFHYGTSEIFHTIIPEDLEDIDVYICKKFNWRLDEL